MINYVFQMFKNEDRGPMPHTPTMKEIEDFFDEILTKTYEQEQHLKQLESDIIKDNSEEIIVPEKKTSCSSQSSGDSGKYFSSSWFRDKT